MQHTWITVVESAALEQGVREFNEGCYFEAHDTLEEAWHGIRGDHRSFFHGLIQMAIGLYHLTGGNLKGAESQLTHSLVKLLPYRPTYLGVGVEEAVLWIGMAVEQLRGQGIGPAGLAPPRVALDSAVLLRHVRAT